MEYSSPLAAMRPQPCPTWTGSNEMDAQYSMFPSFQPLPTKFNFRDMSMNQQRPASRDYFSARLVRGSSPTSSLLADLDANFHIDKSPQVVTPRRSLFTANILRSNAPDVRVSTPPVEEATATGTPMVPSSSPGVDMMDVSPLPHKPAFFVAQVTLPSPTPDETPREAMSSSCPSPQTDALDTFLQLPERRRPLTRPSLSRAKGWSTSNVLQRPASATTELPPFRFGNVATGSLSSTSTPSLAEFVQSPVEMPLSAIDISTSHARRPSLNGNRTSGSPCFGHVRKPSNSRPLFSRPPRKQMRRSLSMFQHPDEVMKEEQEIFDVQPPLMSMIEVETEHNMKLPHFIPDGEPDSLPRITQDTMLDVLNQRYVNDYSKILVIDCRFEYEYDGGHIENAINFNDKQLLSDKLFTDHHSANTLIIFHCEYSVHRAPLTAKYIRNHDRKINAINYPNLTYPEMYILDGGYSRFFAMHRSKCQPQNYVEMSDTRHEQACERGMARVKQRQKLFRNQTFAFGQGTSDADCMEDSPTQNPGRNGIAQRSQSTFDVGPDIAAGIGEKFQRRMASY